MLLIAVVAFIAAGLTLFSGFGLGTILLPAFALFLPIPLAVGATAVVHLANNLFKTGLLGRHAEWGIVLRFGLPGIVAAFAGALVLDWLSESERLATWSLGEQTFPITADRLAVGGLVLFFALFELHPRTGKIAFGRKWLPLGGALSGFLGGISGHQGALRSAFLIRLGLRKEVFLATGILCAVLIDLARLPVYGVTRFAGLLEVWPELLIGTLAAFSGSWLGAWLVQKVTLQAIHLLVGWMLVLLGAAIAAGLV